MSVSGVVEAVDRDSVPNDGTRAWRILVTPDTPTPLAGGDGRPLDSIGFHLARAADPGASRWAVAPIGEGDRVTVPLCHGDRAVPVTRRDGSTAMLHMIGWAFDPAAPLT